MLKFTRGKNNLKYSVIVSIFLHMICIILIDLFYIKRNPSCFKVLTNKKMSVNLSSVDALSQETETLSTITQGEKLTNIKMLEKVPVVTSQKMEKSSTITQEEKLTNIKMLEKIPVVTSQKMTQLSTPSSQRKKTSPHMINKSNTKKIDKNSKKNNHVDEYNVHYILNKLTDHKNILKLKNDTSKQFLENFSFKENTKEHTEILHTINLYKKILTLAISEKFHANPSYFGKQCVLHVNLSSNGTLTNVTCSDDYSPLCQAAVSAVKLAQFPPPPNLEIYKIFKNITLNFSQ